MRTNYVKDGILYINKSLGEESYKSDMAWKNNEATCTMYQLGLASGQIVEVDY